jgi:hypothetical protein
VELKLAPVNSEMQRAQALEPDIEATAAIPRVSRKAKQRTKSVL